MQLTKYAWNFVYNLCHIINVAFGSAIILVIYWTDSNDKSKVSTFLYFPMRCIVHRRHVPADCSMKTSYPDSKLHGATMGPTWVLSPPDGPHGGPTNFAIRVCMLLWESTDQYSPIQGTSSLQYHVISNPFTPFTCPLYVMHGNLGCVPWQYLIASVVLGWP